MKSIKVKDIAAWCEGVLSGDGEAVVSAVTKDSRDVPENSMYIALKGDRFDGNGFIGQVYEKGAVLCVGEIDFKTDKPYIRVKDTRRALLDIAAGYRQLFDIPSVAITGSVGKTTTKEMIASVLSEKYNCLKTEGNFNNEIGMPLTVLKLSDEHGIAVFEMGMSAFGEISNMTRVSRPDMAVISNIGMSHIGNLGSQEGILKAKLEVTEGFGPGSVLAVNGDDKFLCGVDNCIKFGLGEGCDVRGFNLSEDNEGCSFDTELNDRVYNVRVNIPGRHNVHNALSAIAVGLRFGVEPEKIISGIAKAGSVGNRMKITDIGGIKLISDCYNASPDSMRAALGVLKREKPRRIAVLADMLEMGEYSENAHRDVGRHCEGVETVVTVGGAARFIACEAKQFCDTYSFDGNESAKDFLKEFLKPGDCVLVKGSNGMRLSEICEFIEVNFG